MQCYNISINKLKTKLQLFFVTHYNPFLIKLIIYYYVN